MGDLDVKLLREKVGLLAEGSCIYPNDKPSPCPSGYDDDICCEVCFLRFAKPFMKDEVAKAIDIL